MVPSEINEAVGRAHFIAYTEAHLVGMSNEEAMRVANAAAEAKRHALHPSVSPQAFKLDWEQMRQTRERWPTLVREWNAAIEQSRQLREEALRLHNKAQRSSERQAGRLKAIAAGREQDDISPWI